MLKHPYPVRLVDAELKSNLLSRSYKPTSGTAVPKCVSPGGTQPEGGNTTYQTTAVDPTHSNEIPDQVVLSAAPHGALDITLQDGAFSA